MGSTSGTPPNLVTYILFSIFLHTSAYLWNQKYFAMFLPNFVGVLIEIILNV